MKKEKRNKKKNWLWRTRRRRGKCICIARSVCCVCGCCAGRLCSVQNWGAIKKWEVRRENKSSSISQFGLCNPQHTLFFQSFSCLLLFFFSFFLFLSPFSIIFILLISFFLLSPPIFRHRPDLSPETANTLFVNLSLDSFLLYSSLSQKVHRFFIFLW